MRLRKRRRRRNPIVFFDMSIGGAPTGRIVVELRADILPKTVENFLSQCTGDKDLKGTWLHRVVPDFMCQGGDFPVGKDTGFGNVTFLDGASNGMNEAGYVWYGAPHITSSQVFLSTWVKGQHVVVGQVSGGMDVVKKIENEYKE